MAQINGGEFIIMGVPGFGLDFQTRNIIRSVQPAGFILFAHNIEAPRQLRDLTDELRALVKHEPIITVDQEGGRVSRLKEFMTEPPSARAFAEHGDLSLIKEHGRITGQLLRLFGFNLNLAPVLDILVDEKNDNSLKERTYGRTSEEVVRNASQFAESMMSEGILSCGKHYPGYSYAKVDPHNDLPKIQRSKDDMETLEWRSFKAMLPLVDLMMIGHVAYPLIDPSGVPASLSSTMVREILRNDWKFEGCIVTDDLDMGAIKKKFGSAKAAQLALEAGVDLILLCHDIEGVPEIAHTLSAVAEPIQSESFARITSLRNRLAKPEPFSMEAAHKLDEEIKSLREAVLKHSV